MSFTVLSGNYKSSQSISSPLTVPGSSSGFVGKLQIVFISFYYDSAMDSYVLPSADFTVYQKRQPTGENYGLYILMRKIRTSSPSIIVDAHYASHIIVDEDLELVEMIHTGEAASFATAEAGDILLNFRSSYTSNQYGGSSSVAGFTSVYRAGGRYYPHEVSYKVAQTSGTYAISKPSSAYSTSHKANTTLRWRPVTGVQFQIKHNGSMIPATPHLWSGGSLTPVNLNLPS